MNKIFKFLKCQMPFNNEKSFRRAIIVNGAIFIAMLFFLFFAIFNFTILHREEVTTLNLVALFVSSLLFIYIKTTKDIEITAKLSTFSLILFLFSFVYYAHSDHFALIWTIFLPIYAIFANGKKSGLYFSLFFYLIIFSMTFFGIGTWENGEWTIIDWTRFVLASLLILFGVYLNEVAYESYEDKLALARKYEEELIERLSELSITDPLTHLYNRRYYDDIISKMIATAKRNNECINFFILDIDFFKNYNDYYGHSKGDEILTSVAKVVQDHIQRGNDFVFRLGGEEFAGILLSKNKKNAQEWISHLTHEIETLKLEHKKSLCSDYITVSIGLSSKCANEEFSAKDLYLEADKALYEAKLKGRNQTRIAL